MPSFINLFSRGNRSDAEHPSDIELGPTNPDDGQVPTTVAPPAVSQFLPSGMPPQAQQVRMQIEKRRREPEPSTSAVKVRAVEGPTVSLMHEEIKRVEASAREVLDSNHQKVVEKLKAEFGVVVQGYKNDIEDLQESAKKTAELTKEHFDSMRNELDQAKKDAEQAQKENVDFRGLLSALRQEIDDIKAGAAEAPDADAMLQDEGKLVLQHNREIAQLKLNSEAATEEHKKEMAEMRLQMSEFAKAVKDAKETIADLSGQLKTTQARALQAESENSQYRGEIAKLTNDLHEEQKCYKVVEATAAERAIATDAGDPPSAPVPHRRLDLRNSEDAQLASQHEDIDMIDNETVNRTVRDNEHQSDDDIYGSEANEDDDMDVNMSNNTRHRNTGKATSKPHNKEPRAVAVAATSRQVPTPQKVPSSRGGQGARVEIVMGGPLNNRGNQAPSKPRKRYSPEAVEDFFDAETDDEDDNDDDDEERASDADDESDDAEERAEGRKGRDSKRLNVFSNPKLRGNNPKRAKLLRKVRKLMNQILGMEKDVDVVNVDLAELHEVAKYEEDQSEPPTSVGFRPTFQKGFWKTEWHLYLEEAFIDQFAEVHRLDLSDKARDCIAVLFTDRLIRLRKKWTKLTKKMSNAEREEWKARVDSMGRKNVRRLGDYDFRRTVCLESIKTPDGRRDEGWAATLEMVLRLGPAGVSSDESDVQNGKPVYFIRKRHWRSAEVTARILLINQQRNTKNGFGKARPGNPARERIRSAQNDSSTRDPTIKCPENFYDKGYVKGLSNLHFRALKMARPMDLGYIDDA